MGGKKWSLLKMIMPQRKNIVIDTLVTKGTVYFIQQNDGMLVGANSGHKQFVISVLGSPQKIACSDDHDAWFAVEEWDIRVIINNMLKA